MPIELVRPARAHLPSYRAALERGWSPDNVMPRETALRELSAMAEDVDRFLAALDDPEAKGGPIRMADGSIKPRLPGFRRWMWDGEFCGSIGFRWQHGTAALPPHMLGHIGYAVVPWKRRRGVATLGLALLLSEIAPLGLPHVELTTEPDNAASVAVITANGGVLVEHFTKDAAYGGGAAMRYRITLPPRPQGSSPEMP